jgi:hypothetical protein
MENEYIVEFNGKDYRFFTNGYLHREKGPALFIKEEKEKYLNLGDEYLFTEVNTENKNDSFQNFIKNLVSLTGEKAFYYLYDIQYKKDEFDSIILNHELQQDLSNNNITNKTPKI